MWRGEGGCTYQLQVGICIGCTAVPPIQEVVSHSRQLHGTRDYRAVLWSDVVRHRLLKRLGNWLLEHSLQDSDSCLGDHTGVGTSEVWVADVMLARTAWLDAPLPKP